MAHECTFQLQRSSVPDLHIICVCVCVCVCEVCVCVSVYIEKLSENDNKVHTK